MQSCFRAGVYFKKLSIIYSVIIFCLIFILIPHQTIAIDAIDQTNGGDYSERQLEESKEARHINTVNYSNLDTTNLTNNIEDSIYGQVEAFENSVYVVWEQSVTKRFRDDNYDVFFVKSEDRGKTFGKPVNLSNSTNHSEHPQIAVSKTGIFVVWAEVNSSKSGTSEILFTKSVDNGKSFSKVQGLSDASKFSNNQEISAVNKDVYVVWQESKDRNATGSITFKNSIDAGNTFKDPINFKNDNVHSFPKISSQNNYVYLVWNNENKKNNGLFFVKSSNNGKSFEDIVKISNDDNVGETQITVDKNEVLVIWGGLDTKQIDNIYYVSSNDNGKTFTDPKTISADINDFNRTDYEQLNNTISNPRNVELKKDENHTYIVWQNNLPKQNLDILMLVLSADEGSKEITLSNLSNNYGDSDCPSIAISDKNIYVVWQDFTTGNHEIFFLNVML
jgi:hypothetical protein